MRTGGAQVTGLPPKVRSRIARLVRKQFRIDYRGDHGAAHWGRVRENGLRLAKLTGARVHVVELFALLHDSQRENEGRDPEHGWRAARFAQSLAGDVFAIGRSDLDLLMEACEGHSEGRIKADITVATCWDADRLDLGRVGYYPDPERLCTEAARDLRVIEWAYARSVRHGGE